MLILPFLHLSYLITTFLALKRQKPTNKAGSLYESRLERALVLAKLPLQKGFCELASYRPSPNLFRDTFRDTCSETWTEILGLFLELD